jgi:hypothetical protein
MSLAQAVTDWRRFTQAGFAVDLVFTAPNSQVASVRGLASRHNLSVNPEDGLPVNSPNTHVTVVESVILENNASYPTRNAENEISLKGHLVLYEGKTYKISENWISETVNTIVCIIDDFE